MKDAWRWLNERDFDLIRKEDTTAFRVATSPVGWVDVYGESAVISLKRMDEVDSVREGLRAWVSACDWSISSVARRMLVKQADASDRCVWLEGREPDEEHSVVRELGFRYRVDFSSGYSCGLFCDQRENRKYLASLKPRRVLNCFAYTCAFSVVAAGMGAITCNVDLSRKALEWGKANFVLNGLDRDVHAFYFADVLRKLPQLARRGEQFDVIILDPPTFSRGEGGRVFRVEKQFEELLRMALRCAAPRAHLLLSTNHQELDGHWLKWQAGMAIGGEVNRLSFHEVARPVDFRFGVAATSVWAEAIADCGSRTAELKENKGG